MRRALSVLLLALLAVTGCASGPSEIDSQHAFVRRSGSTADTLRVGRADTLRARVDAQLLTGRLAWALRDPDGRVAWTGATGEADTVAAFVMAAPARGDWRLVLTPDSAVGVVDVHAAAR